MKSKIRRVLSLALALCMILGLFLTMPGFTKEVFADWEDGEECEYCGHYHWDDYLCGDGPHCSGECDSDCYADHHCELCRDPLEEDEICEDCHFCFDCADGTTHCLICGECYLAGTMEPCDATDDYYGYTICYDCCSTADINHCEYCDEHIEGVQEWCSWGGRESEHCEDCHMGGDDTFCPECERCFFCEPDNYCEDCGFCLDCCATHSYAEGCVHEICLESEDYEDHLCEYCNLCPGEEEKCEFCERCVECQEEYHCEHGYCPDDSDFQEHVCPGCGDCFDPSELCETCGRCEDCAEGDTHCEHGICRDSGDYDSDHACQKCGTCEAMDFEGDVCDYCGYCHVCCEQATADMGCTHGICVKDPQFKEHYCYKHHRCIEKCDHDPCTHENLKSGYQKDEKYHWQICADCGAVVKNEKHNEDTSVIVTAPDPVNKKNGLTRYSCSVCGQDMGTAVVPYEVPAHDHKYNTGGYCTICGEKAQGEPYIVRDPRSVSRITPTLKEIEGGTVDPVVFSVKAKGDEPLYYQWYKYNSVTGTSEAMIGEMESTLSIPLEQDCCQVDYFEYYCDVSNEKGNATSARAKLQIRHNWKGYISVADGGTVTVPDPEYAENHKTRTAFASDTHTKCCANCFEEKPVAKKQPHVYGEWTTLCPATDEYVGYRVRECGFCGYKDYKKIPKVEAGHTHSYSWTALDDEKHVKECVCGLRNGQSASHEWSDTWTVTIPPTETTEGESTNACTDCGYTRKVPVAKRPHQHEFYTFDEFYDMLTATDKLDKHITKKDSDGNFLEGYYTLASDPSEKVFGADQKYHWYYCKVSGCDKKKNEAHEFNGWIGVGADSESATYYSDCKTCGFRISKTVPRNNYNVNVINGYADKNTMMNGAKPGQPVTLTAAESAGDLADKYFDHWEIVSSECAASFDDASSKVTTLTFSANPHEADADFNPLTQNKINVRAVFTDCNHVGCGRVERFAEEPTCTDDGKKADIVCERCNHVITAGASIPALGHTEPVFDESSVKPVKCTDASGARYYTGDYKCTRCGAVLIKGKYTNAERKHGDTELRKVKEATCRSAGYTGDTVCTLCNKTLEKGASIPQKEHNWGEWTVKKAPTSEKTGTEIRYCQNEGCKASETREIAKLSTEVKVQSGRSLSWKYFYGETPAAKDIVLTSAGTNKIVAITELPDSIFRFILEIDETDPMLIHVKPQTFLWADTFNEELWQVKVRYEDGTEGWWSPADGSAASTLKAEVVPALETYSVKVTGGTACNPSDKTNPITEAHPGEQVYVVADSDKIPECKEFDYWVEKHGTELDDSEDLQEEEALFTMPAADVELEAALKLVSHIGPEELKDAKEASCTKDGYTGNTVCAECGDVLKIGTAIPFKGHSFGPWIHTGSHTHTCTVCKYSETEECTFGDWVVTKQPTAAEKGEKEHTCSKCGYVEKAVIPATGTTANPDSNSPKTGDSRHTALWIILMLSAAVCAFGGIRKRKTTGK